jgi:hypothetical protein
VVVVVVVVRMMGRLRRALAGTSVRVCAKSILHATQMPAEMHVKAKPMQVIAGALILRMLVGTAPARRSAPKVSLAKLKHVKTHVTV